MKILLKALLITFLLIGLFSSPTYGQEGAEPVIPPEFPKDDLRFQHLTTEDGLSAGRVWGITQENRNCTNFLVF